MRVDKEIITTMVRLYGEEAQLAMVAEEATELSLAVQKYLRKRKNAVPGDYKDERVLIDQMTEEAADMYIVLENIKYLFGEIAIQEVIDRKIKRQWDRIKAVKELGGEK